MTTLTKEKIKALRSLKERSSRYEQQEFLVEGEKIIAELKNTPFHIKELYCSPLFLNKKKQADLHFGSEIICISTEQLTRFVSTDTSPGIAAVVSMPQPSTDALLNAQTIGCFINISDPGNLGTMIRTAEWFGLKALLLSEHCVDPFNEKVIRASMGAVFHIPLIQSRDVIADLKNLQKSQVQLISTDVHGGNHTIQPNSNYCLLMGSESHGLPEEYKNMADSVFTIPQFGSSESLNVAVSFGIALYQLKTSHGSSIN